MGRGCPAALSVQNPLWARSESQRISAPVLWQALCQRASTHFQAPLPSIGQSQSCNRATAQAGKATDLHYGRNCGGNFEGGNYRKFKSADLHFVPHGRLVKLPIVEGGSVTILTMPWISP